MKASHRAFNNQEKAGFTELEPLPSTCSSVHSKGRKMPQLFRFFILLVSMTCWAFASQYVEEAVVIDPDSGEMILKFSGNVERSGGSTILTVSDFVYTSGGGNVTAISSMGADSDGSDGEVSVFVNTAFSMADLSDAVGFNVGAGLVDAGDGVTGVLGNSANVIIEEPGSIAFDIVPGSVITELNPGDFTTVFELELYSDMLVSLDELTFSFIGLDSNEVANVNVYDVSNNSPIGVVINNNFDDTSVAGAGSGFSVNGMVALAVNVVLDTVNINSPDFEITMNPSFFQVDGVDNGGPDSLSTGVITVTGGGNSNVVFGSDVFDIILEKSYTDVYGYNLYLEVNASDNLLALSLETPNSTLLTSYETDLSGNGYRFELDGTVASNLFDFNGAYGTSGNFTVSLTDLNGKVISFSTAFVEDIPQESPVLTAPSNLMDLAQPIAFEWDDILSGTIDFMDIEVIQLTGANIQNEFSDSGLLPQPYSFMSNFDEGESFEAEISNQVTLEQAVEAFDNGESFNFNKVFWHSTLFNFTTEPATQPAPVFSTNVYSVILEKNYDNMYGYGIWAEVNVSDNLQSVALITPSNEVLTGFESTSDNGMYRFELENSQAFTALGDFNTHYENGGTDYTFEVTDLNGTMISFSTTFVGDIAALTPEITSPDFNSGSIGQPITFEWTPVSGANHQDLEIISASNTEYEFEGNTLTSHSFGLLEYNQNFQGDVGNEVLLSVTNENFDDGSPFELRKIFWHSTTFNFSTGEDQGPVLVSNDSGFMPDTFHIDDGAQGVEVLSFILDRDGGVFSDNVSVDEVTIDVDFPNASGSDFTNELSAELYLNDVLLASSAAYHSNGANTISFSGLSSEVVLEPGMPQNLSLQIDVVAFPAQGQVNFSLSPENVMTASGNGYGGFLDYTFNVGSALSAGNVIVRNAKYEVNPENGALEIGVAGNVDLYFSYRAGPSDLGFDTLEISIPDDFYSVAVNEVSVAGNLSSAPGDFVVIPGGNYTTNVDEGAQTVEIAFSNNYTDTNADDVFRVQLVGTAVSDSNAGTKYLYLSLSHSTDTVVVSAGASDDTVLYYVSDDPETIFVNPATVTNENVVDVVAEIDTNPTLSTGVETNSTVNFVTYINAQVDSTVLGFDQIELSHPIVFNENDSSGNAGKIISTVTVELFNSSLGTYQDFSGSFSKTARVGSLTLNSAFVIDEALTNGTNEATLRISYSAFTGNVSTAQPYLFEVQVNNTTNLGAPEPAVAGNADPEDISGIRDSLALPFILGNSAPEGESVAELYFDLEPQSTPRTSSDLDVKALVYYVQNSGAISGVGFDKMYVSIPQNFAVKPGSINFSFDGGTTFVTVGADGSGVTGSYDQGLLELGFNSDQTGAANVQVYFTVTTPDNPVNFAPFSVDVEKEGTLSSYAYGQTLDLDGDGAARSALNVTEELSTYANVSDLFYETQIRDNYAGNINSSANVDTSPYWHVFVSPVIDSGNNDQGFNRLVINLFANEFELGANSPSDTQVYTVDSTMVADENQWVDISGNISTPALDNVDLLQVNFDHVQTNDSLTYVVVFNKRVTSVSDFVGVSQVGVNNSDNPAGASFDFSDAVDVDGDATSNNFGFNVEATAVVDQAVATTFEADLETSGNVYANSTGSFSLYMLVDATSADSGYDRFKIEYPGDLSNMSINQIAKSTSLNDLLDANISSVEIVQPSFYEVNTDIAGETRVKLGSKISNSTMYLRIDVTALAPSLPFIDELAVFIADTSTGRSKRAIPAEIDAVFGGGSLVVEVISNAAKEDLDEVLAAAKTELIVVPADSANEFIVPGSRPTMSLVLSTYQTSNEAGFDLIDIRAAAGFGLPDSFEVYRSANINDLSSSASRLDSSEYEVNTSSVATGSVKIEFVSEQTFNLISTLSGYSSGNAFYRIEFSPTAPQVEGRTHFGVELTNTENDKPFFPSVANILSGSVDLYSSEVTVVDRDSLEVEVFIPHNADAKDPVDSLIAEASFEVEESGNTIRKGSLEVNTEATLVIDFQTMVAVTANVNGFNRVILELPEGFSEPSDISLTRLTNDGNYDVSANLLITEDYSVDTSLLIVDIVADDQLLSGTQNYELRLTAVSGKQPKPLDIEYFAVDYTQESNEFPASNGNALPDAPSNKLFVDILQKELSQSELDAQYASAVVNDLVLELDPSYVTSGSVGAEVTAYFKADALSGTQQGFDYLVLDYPFELTNVSGVEVFNSTDGTSFTQMDIGLAGQSLDGVSVNSDDQEITVTFSDLIATDADATIKIVFTADFPAEQLNVDFGGSVEIVGTSLSVSARSGDAFATATNNKAKLFIEVDSSAVDHNKEPLETFVAEVVGGNTINGFDYPTGKVFADSESIIDVYFLAEKGSAANFTGFDGLKLDVPFSMAEGQLKTITVSSSSNSSFTSADNFIQIASSDLTLTDSDTEIKIDFGSEVDLNSESYVFRIRLRIETPEDARLYAFGLEAFSSSNPGIFQSPVIEGVSTISSGFTPNNSDEVRVIADLSGTNSDDIFSTSLVSSLIAEVSPSFVIEGATTTFSVAANATFSATDTGFDRMILSLPESFGTPGTVVLSIDGEDLQPSAYSSVPENGKVELTLIDSSISSNSLLGISFSASTPKPGMYHFDLGVKSSSDSVSFKKAGFGDVIDGGNDSLIVNIYSDFNNIVYVEPIDRLYGELNVGLQDGSAGDIVTESLIAVDYFVRAEFDSATTASGFDQLNLKLPASFGDFPGTISVNVIEDNGSSKFLLQGSVSGFTLDTTDTTAPVITFGEVYSSNVTVKISFDVTTPEDADVYMIKASVENTEVTVERSVQFGEIDLDGDDVDGNRIAVSVFRDTSIDLSGLYVVDDLFAEIDLVEGDQLLVNTGVDLRISARVSNDTSGNGFDKIFIRMDDKVVYNDFVSLSTSQGNLVKDVDYFVDAADLNFVVIELETTYLDTIGELDLFMVFSVNTPNEPTDITFNLAVDNDALDAFVVALPTSDDTTLIDFAGSNDGLSLNVEKDYSGAVGDSGVIEQTLLTSLIAESVFVDDLDQTSKQAEVSSTSTVRVYVQPEIGATDLGINRLRVTAPINFGTPTNVSVYVNGTFSTNVERQKLEAESVDYVLEIDDQKNRVSIDFSTAQRESYVTSSNLLNNLSSPDSITSIEVEFTVLLPEDAGEYDLKVQADNSGLNLPQTAAVGDVNGELDDGNDGEDDNFLDNKTNLYVNAIEINSDDYKGLSNARKLSAELISSNSGEINTSAEMSFAFTAEVTASDNGIDRLVIQLPSDFSNINSVTVAVGNVNSGVFVGDNLVLVNDYNLETDDPTNMKVLFENVYTDTTSFMVNFVVTLPSVENTKIRFGSFVNNSSTPKPKYAVPANVLDDGTNQMKFSVDPASVSDDELTTSLLTSLTAKVGVVADDGSYSSTSIIKGSTNTIDLVLNAGFANSDIGFDQILIRSDDYVSLSDVEVVVSANSTTTQYFRYSNFDTFETDLGIGVYFFEPIKEFDAELIVSFSALAGDQPSEGRFEILVKNSKFPLVETAELASAGFLEVPVLDERKSSDELQTIPSLPVSDLVYDISPSVVTAGNVEDFSIYIEATSDAGEVRDTDIVPANTGFDQIVFTIPSIYGDLIGLELFSYGSSFDNSANLLQRSIDYDYSLVDNTVVLNLLVDQFDGASVNSQTARLSTNITLDTPLLPGSSEFYVNVLDTAKSTESVGVSGNLDSDGIANSFVLVQASASASTLGVTNSANASLVLDVDSDGLVYPTVSDDSFSYKVRFNADVVSGYAGFDIVKLAMPTDFLNVAITGISSNVSGNLLPLVESSSGYQIEPIGVDNEALIFFGSTQQTSSANAVEYYEITITADMPPENAVYFHSLTLVNYTEGSFDVVPGSVLGTTDETSSLGLSAELPSTGSTKVGFFGHEDGSIIDSLTATVTAWNEDEQIYSSNVSPQVDSSLFNVIVQTTPSFTSSNDGFDYMKIELPAGTGEPTNGVVFFRSAEGNVVFLEEYYDYRVRSTATAITVQFIDETGAPVIIDQSYVEGDSNVFNDKLGLDVDVVSMFVSFDIELPQRLGRHYFDVYVLNTDPDISEIYYADSANSSEPRDTVIGTGTAGSTVARRAEESGTEFLYIDLSNSDAVTAITSLTAELQAVGSTVLPVDSNRSLTLDFAADLSGADDSFDVLELQLPYGFASVTNVVITETDTSNEANSTALTEFTDYTLDFSHERNVTVNFTSSMTGSDVRKFRITFDIQTPVDLPEVLDGEDERESTSYVFGLVAYQTESGVISTSAVQAQSGDVVLGNTSGDLSVSVRKNSVISGTVSLDNAAMADLLVTLELFIDPEAAVRVTETVVINEGETSADYTFSISSSTQITFGLEAGTYDVVASAKQYVSGQVEDIEIVDTTAASSVFDQDITLTSEDVQAVATLTPSSVLPAGSETLTLVLETRVNGTTPTSVDLSFTATTGATGSFASSSLDSVSFDGVAQASSIISQSGSDYSVDLSSYAGSNITIVYSVTAGSDQLGLFDLSASFVEGSSSYESYLADGLDSSDARILFGVGTSLELIVSDLTAGVLNVAYSSVSISYFIDSRYVNESELVFTQSGLPSDLGMSLSSSGVLSGTPVRGGVFSFDVTVSANSLTDTETFELYVEQGELGIYSLQPVAIPSTGESTFKISGEGFSVDTEVLVNGSAVTASFIDTFTMKVTIADGELSAGTSHSVSVVENDVTLTIPNAVNSLALTVAAPETLTDAMTSNIEGEADALDYDIMGIKSFYQAPVRKILEDAFGSYNITSWRVFAHDPVEGSKELIDIEVTDTTAITPGQGFWRISRVGGDIVADGVNPEEVPSYTVSLYPQAWSLVANLYDNSVVWDDVSVLAGNVSEPFTGTIGAAKDETDSSVTTALSYVNQTLWGMDKSGESGTLTRPYQAVDSMESGKGYWVYNKSSEFVSLQIDKPSVAVTKAKATAGTEEEASFVSYKPDEEQPPEVPVTFQKANASAGGGGGGCLLR